MKFLSARAGAAQSSSVFNCFGKGGTDQKDTSLRSWRDCSRAT